MERIAGRILLLSRSSISINMRYMDPAVFALEPVSGAISLGTDGRHLFYDPEYLIHEYRKEKTTMTRNYMHVILHCIFQHAFIHKNMNRPYWDLACDIAVENLINQQELDCFRSAREEREHKTLQQLDLPLRDLTAERLYRHFLESDFSEEQIRLLREVFYADDHEIWYADPDPGGDGNGEQDDRRQDDNDEPNPDNRRQEELQDPNRADRQEQSEQQWKDISRRIQVDLETLSKEPGQEEGGLLIDLRELHRERYDYTAFLRKFAVVGEELMVNDEEFDTIFYTYGLELYGDMPLIEPLEYKEVKRIRDFVVAVDTSASTSGELVQKFLQKTFNVLKSSETYFSKVNLYVIQADVDITRVDVIHDMRDIDDFVDGLRFYGQGGTDFRPVFQYVSELIRQQKFQRLKGLLYFTDGYGPFPKSKPPYDTAFVFLHREHEDPQVPPWAIKVVLPEEEF